MDSWWLCEQLLELSSMSENEEGFSVVLPRSDAVKAQRDWHATEKEVCKAEMKLAVPNDEARAAKVLLYEGIFYQVVAEESSENDEGGDAGLINTAQMMTIMQLVKHTWQKSLETHQFPHIR